MKFRKKPVVIEATQWFHHGDHPKVMPMYTTTENGTIYQAYINTLEGNMIVSPGDYIITGVKGETYSCKEEIFKMTYEAAE